MKRYFIFLPALIISTLTGCASITEEQYPEVDVRSQIRSMIYTQRELLTIELAQPTPTDKTRYNNLLRSYCDLSDRRIILVTSPSNVCEQPLTAIERKCVAKFHKDIRRCNFRQGQCISSEIALKDCLES